jgi:hypothetical protein
LVLRTASRLAVPAIVAALAVGCSSSAQKTAVPRVELVPHGAALLDAQILHGANPPKLAVAWVANANSYPQTFGVTIWERRGPSWRRLYDRRIRSGKGTNLISLAGLNLDAVDLTRDGIDELIVYEDRDGSAGGFLYRVLAVTPRVRQLEARLTSQDETALFVRYGELISYDAVGRTPETANAVHCCPLYWIRTVERWNGHGLRAVSRKRVEQPPRGDLTRLPGR